MPDWIDAFVADTETLSAYEFRLWTGITIIAGALERRVYTVTDKDLLYPNLYTLLSGGPGSGKTLMVNQARRYWASVPGLHVGPDNPNKRTLLDCLQKSIRTIGQANGHDFDIFCAMSVASRELGVFISRYDIETVSDLSDIYDNPPKYYGPRATVDDINVEKPTLNIIAGVTPDFIGDLFPDVAWGQGLASRLFFIYGIPMVSKSRDVLKRREKKHSGGLELDLNKTFELIGEFIWTDDAHDALNNWENTGRPPTPTYEKLRYYNDRRLAHVIKLSMIAAVSRHQKLTIELEDFERAKQWLLDAELLMPNVFRAMSQKTDVQTLKDMHYHLWTMYSGVEIKKRKPIPEQIIHDWLQQHTTTDRIPRLFDAAVKSGYIKKSDMYQGHWVPRPIDQVGDVL